MVQPNPHGSYVRKSIRHHFPNWWKDVSKTLEENGVNVMEMDSYDEKTDMPEITGKFDTTLL